jgi:hypothetical protein
VGFSSLDDFINEVTVNGKFQRTDWNKLALPTTNEALGLWYDYSTAPGNPGSDTAYGSGTNLSFQALNDRSTTSPGIPHGGDVSPDTKHVMNGSVFSAVAASAPAVFMLVDRIGYYPITTTGSGAVNQALVNSVTFTGANATDIITHTGWDIANGLPAGLSAGVTYYTVRQSATTSKLATSLANATATTPTTVDFTTDGTGTHTITWFNDRDLATAGAGLRAYLVCSSGAATTAMGAATPNLDITYTRQATGGTDTGRATPTVLPIGTTAAPKGNIVYSGAGAGKYGPFLPLQAGDAGIQSIQNFRLSVSYVSGVLNLVLCRPLCTIPVSTVGVAGERDFLNQIPSLPRVFDGANLALIKYAGAVTTTNTSYAGHFDFGWG